MSSTKHDRQWRLKNQTLEAGRWPRVMGIVNVTPDSFSDGGKFFDQELAIQHALMLVKDGADILDVGGESTRPYSDPVSEQQEIDRVIPVIESLTQQTETPISIDTSKASVARFATRAGAEIINDVTGLEGDPDMIGVALASGAGICAMHMQGNPKIMQDAPQYDDVVNDVFGYLLKRRDDLLNAGLQAERICLDPGIGFGKTHEHNFQLLRHVERFHELGHPILVGHSRKGFIGKAIGNKAAERDYGTLAASLLLAEKGVQILRVHNVAATIHGLRIWKAIQSTNRSN